ncbi:MAG: BatA domain-containing protein, partial [Pseudohongiella sp.]
MSFLSPLFLFGLLAAAIPVAIHLIRRENPPRIMFGTLRFLKQTTKKLILFQQIQQWLLLLLRAALVCLLAFAFARPLFYEGSVAQLLDAEPQSTVLLIDTSLSMQYGDRFEQAKQQALQALDGLSAGDEAGVISFADGTLSVRELSTDIAGLRTFVSNLPPPGYERARFFPALRLANDMLTRSRHEQRSIVMMSDFQATGMSGAADDGNNDAAWKLAPGVAFTGINVGDERSTNLSLVDVRSPQQLMASAVNSDAVNSDNSQADTTLVSEPAAAEQVLARVRSTGSVLLERGDISLLINGERQEQQGFEFGDRSEAVLDLPLALDGSGSYTGELVVAGDAFDIDNRWYFTLDVMPTMRILVINGDPADDWYDDEAHWFVLALEGMENSPFTVTRVTTEQLATVELERHDAVVMLNVGSLGGSWLQSLETFVADGGSLLLAPGDLVDAASFNQQLGNLTPARLSEAEVLPASDYRLIADVDRRHPALDSLDVGWSARFQGYWLSEPVPGSSVLMRFDSGDPMLTEHAVGEGRAMLLSSALDLGWSNFPLQGLYLPFVHETLTYMIQPAPQQRAWQVTDMVDLTPAFADGASALVLTEPDGSTMTVEAESPFYRARMPGFVRTDNGFNFAVNIQPEAASLAQVDVTVLHDRILN